MSHQIKILLEKLIQQDQQLSSAVKVRLMQAYLLAQYIEQSTLLREASRQRSETAIKVMTQVNEGLVMGANTATEASIQLTLAVEQLQRVLGA